MCDFSDVTNENHKFILQDLFTTDPNMFSTEMMSMFRKFSKMNNFSICEIAGIAPIFKLPIVINACSKKTDSTTMENLKIYLNFISKKTGVSITGKMIDLLMTDFAFTSSSTSVKKVKVIEVSTDCIGGISQSSSDFLLQQKRDIVSEALRNGKLQKIFGESIGNSKRHTSETDIPLLLIRALFSVTNGISVLGNSFGFDVKQKQIEDLK